VFAPPSLAFVDPPTRRRGLHGTPGGRQPPNASPGLSCRPPGAPPTQARPHRPPASRPSLSRPRTRPRRRRWPEAMLMDTRLALQASPGSGGEKPLQVVSRLRGVHGRPRCAAGRTGRSAALPEPPGYGRPELQHPAPPAWPPHLECRPQARRRPTGPWPDEPEADQAGGARDRALPSPASRTRVDDDAAVDPAHEQRTRGAERPVSGRLAQGPRSPTASTPSASVGATTSSATSSAPAPATTSMSPPTAAACSTSVVPPLRSLSSKPRRSTSSSSSCRQAWRERWQNHPNDILLLFDTADRRRAEEFGRSDDLREAMQRAGVVGQPEIQYAE